MSAHLDAGKAPPEERSAAPLVLAGLVVLVAWCAAVVSGLGHALLGANAPAWAHFLLLLPGVAAGSGLLALAALRVLSRHAPRWCPTEPPEPPAASAPRDDEVTSAAPGAPPPRLRRGLTPAAPELAIVHLGPAADPAWAAWALRWEAPGHGAGLVPLPSGGRVLLGRDPQADIVVRLDQVSWHHLELDVQEARVTAFDLGSSNGTRATPEGEALPGRTPLPWAPGEALHLAHPVALSLTLEPLR